MTQIKKYIKILKDVWSTKQHCLSLSLSRSDLIYKRVKLCCLVSALLMLAWLPLDLLFLGIKDAAPIIIARASVAALCLLFYRYRPKLLTTLLGDLSLFLLIGLATAFFCYANFQLSAIDWGPDTLYIKASYAHFPILFMMLLCFFPLTIIECIGFITIIAAPTIWLALNSALPAAMLIEIGTISILLTIAFLSSLVSLTQLSFIGQLIQLSTHDAMTGAMRRDYGEQMLDTLFSLAKRKNEPLTIIFIDLDNFKEVNDIHGHEQGDVVLKNAAHHMQSVLRKEDSLIRWGGEEFIMVLPNTQLGHVEKIIARLGKEGIGDKPNGLKQTASGGACEYKFDKKRTMSSLLICADQRMYDAKNSGKNKINLGSQEFTMIENV